MKTFLFAVLLVSGTATANEGRPDFDPEKYVVLTGQALSNEITFGSMMNMLKGIADERGKDRAVLILGGEMNMNPIPDEEGGLTTYGPKDPEYFPRSKAEPLTDLILAEAVRSNSASQQALDESLCGPHGPKLFNREAAAVLQNAYSVSDREKGVSLQRVLAAIDTKYHGAFYRWINDFKNDLRSTRTRMPIESDDVVYTKVTEICGESYAEGEAK